MWNGLSSESRDSLLRALGARRTKGGRSRPPLGRPQAARRGSLDGARSVMPMTMG